MWTFNGAKTLPQVLDRINVVIPDELVNQKFIVDDFSTDNTREIAESKGWTVYFNSERGISNGANYALKLVKTDWFCSFEQDLLLNRRWLSKVLNRIGENVFAVSGVRFASNPVGLKKLQEYVYKKYIGESKIPAWLRSREYSSFTLGKTLDNTLWNTAKLRELNGFPDLGLNAGIDTALAYKAHVKGYRWIVDYSIKSVHLRLGGLKQELKHQCFYGSTLKCTWAYLTYNGITPPINSFSVLFRLFTSPLTGLFVSVKTRTPSVFLVHPLIRLYYTKGLLKGV